MPMVKKLIKNRLRKVAMLIQQRPMLKRVALRLLSFSPGLRRRLQGLVHGPISSAHRSQVALVLKSMHDLSPHARRIYVRIMLSQKKS